MFQDPNPAKSNCSQPNNYCLRTRTLRKAIVHNLLNNNCLRTGTLGNAIVHNRTTIRHLFYDKHLSAKHVHHLAFSEPILDPTGQLIQLRESLRYNHNEFTWGWLIQFVHDFVISSKSISLLVSCNWDIPTFGEASGSNVRAKLIRSARRPDSPPERFFIRFNSPLIQTDITAIDIEVYPPTVSKMNLRSRRSMAPVSNLPFITGQSPLLLN